MKPLIITVLFFTVGLALYHTSLSNPFVLDDLTKIQENLDLRTPFQISNFVYPYGERTMHFRNDPSRPLTFMAWWVCWHTARGATWPFHVLPLFLHMLNALLLARLTENILRRWSLPSTLAGVTAGLLFLTSPLMAGTAVYAYGLSDVLSTFLLLLALVLLTQSIAKLPLVLATLCFLLALATKQSAIVLPGLIVLIDYFTGKAAERERWKLIYLPLGVLAALYIVGRLAYFGALGDLEGQAGAFQRGEYLSTQGVMILKYIVLTVWPQGFAVDHREIPRLLSNFAIWGSWGLVIVLTLAAFEIGLRRQWPPIVKLAALGWSFYLLCLLPVSSVFPTVDLFVERRAYTANLGLYFGAAGVLLLLSQRSKLWQRGIAVFVVAILLAQSAVAMQRSELYGSPEGLWREALALDPENPRALINLSVYYSAVGRLEDARKVLEELIRKQPDNGSLYSKLAYIFMNDGYPQKDYVLAESYLDRAIRLDPNNIFAYYNAGILKMKRLQYADAEKFFREALRLAPQMALAAFAAGQAARMQGHSEDAVGYFTETLRLDPDNVNAKRELMNLRGR